MASIVFNGLVQACTKLGEEPFFDPFRGPICSIYLNRKGFPEVPERSVAQVIHLMELQGAISSGEYYHRVIICANLR